MKAFAVSAFLQAVILLVGSTPSVSPIGGFVQEVTSGLDKEDAVNDPIRSYGFIPGSNRQGRILASYGLNIQKNTVAAVSQLERVASTVGNATVQIESLLTSLSTSDAQILTAVSAIDTSLAAGGAIATKLDTISTSLGSILTAVTDSTTPGTLLNQLSSLYTLLDTKLSNFEQIFGYDNYPPAPAF